MELMHRFELDGDPVEVWQLLMDIPGIGDCFPGATVSATSEDGFEGTVKVKLGPMSFLYAGSGAVIERNDQLMHAVVEASGKDRRGQGNASATVTLDLDHYAGGSQVRMRTDLNITGKPAQFGRGVLQDVSDQLLRQFVDCVQMSLGASQIEAETRVVAAEAAPTEMAVGVGAALPVGAVPLIRQRSETSAVSAPNPDRSADVDLMTALVPVLARRYGGYIAALGIGFAIGWIAHRS